MFKKHSQIPADPNHVKADSHLALPVSGLGRRKLLKGLGYSLAGLSASLPLTSSLAVAAAPAPTSASGRSIGSSAHSDPHFDPNAQPKGPSTSPLTFTQTFSGYDFRPAGSPTTYTYVNDGGIYWQGADDPTFFRRLDLPQGSKVTNVTFHITDNDSSNVHVYLLTLSPLTHTLNIVVNLTSSGASPAAQALSTTGTAAAPIATIDNASYSYQLAFSSGIGNSNHILWGVQVSYTNVVGRFQAD